MAAIDVVNRVLREFRRYTGDGLPGEPVNAPLPVGDPQSGVHSPKKAELRTALLSTIDGGGEAAQAVIDANLPAILEARDDAEASASAAWDSAHAASASATQAGIDADRAEGYAAAAGAASGLLSRKTVALLIADTVFSYTAGEGKTLVAPGDIVTAQGFRYEVAASGATDAHVETAGVVKLYVLPGERGLNVLAFGAKGDGVTDDTAAIQKALDAVPNAGTIYLPKLGGGFAGPSFYISSGLTLAKNDVTICSDPKAEYSEGFKTDQSIDMLTITGFGAKLQNIAFQGDAVASNVFGTANAVIIDRRSLGVAETYSNLDAEIKDCFFFRVNIGIQGYGRNVFVFDNTFSDCKRAVVGVLFDPVNFPLSQFRGWRISSNRFHGCGYPYHPASGGDVVAPASPALLDSWCIEMPQTGAATMHLEIFNNNCDFNGAGFYKGFTSGLKMDGNILYGCIALLIYAVLTDTDNANLNDSIFGVCENNTMMNRRVTSTATKGAWISMNGIILTNVRNFTVKGNVGDSFFQDAIVADNCRRLRLSNNRFFNANTRGLGDAVKRPCMTIVNTNGATILGNDLISQGDVYSSGIAAASCSNLKLRDNTIEGATVRYAIPPEALTNAIDEGLSWIAPTMQNGYVLGADSKGYRRMLDGRVELSLSVSGGADNVAAFTLPVGCRPSISMTFPAISVWNTDTEAVATIGTNGQVIVNWKASTSTAASYQLRFSFEASA